MHSVQLVPVSEWTSARLRLDDADRVAVVGLLGGAVQSVTPTARAGEFDVVLGSVAGRIALPSGIVLDVELARPRRRRDRLHRAAEEPDDGDADRVVQAEPR